MAISLGSINFGLGVDTSGLNQGIRAVQNLGARVQATAAQAGAGMRQLEQAYRRQEAAILNALQATLRYNQEARRMQMPTSAVNQASAAFNQFATAMSRGRLSALDFQRVMERHQATMGTLRRDMAAFKPTPPGAEFKVWLQDLTSAAVLVAGPLSGVGARIAALTAIVGRSSLALAGFVAGITAAGVALGAMVKGSITTELSFGKIEARLEALNGTNAEARLEFNKLRQIAENTGIVFTDLANQFTRLRAASAGTSLEGQKTFEIFENITTAAARFQLEGHEVEGVFRALEQIMSKGTVQAEELRNQLGDRLPGAFQAAARAMGVTTSELNKMLKQGQVTSEQFLLPFSREVLKTLGGDASGAVNTLRAALGRLTTSWQFVQRSFNEVTGASTVFKNAVQSLTGILSDASNNMQHLLRTVITLSSAFAALALPGIIRLILSLAGAIRTAVVAMTAFNAAVLANPLGGLLAVLLRVGLGVAGFAGGLVLANKVLGESSVAHNQLTEDVDEYIKAQEGAKDALRSTTQTFIDEVSKQIEAQEIQREALLKFIQVTQQRVNANPAVQPENVLGGLGGVLRDFLRDTSNFTGGVFSFLVKDSDQDKVDTAVKQLQALGYGVNEAREQLLKLQAIANKPDSALSRALGDPAQTDRQIKALREAGQAMADIAQARDAMLQGPVAFREFERMDEIADKVSAFKDRLIDAKVSTAEADRLAAQYRNTLLSFQAVSEGPFAGAMASFEAFKQAGTSAFNSVATALADMIVEGKLNAMAFVDIFKSMVKEIIAEVLRLVIINRILNSIIPGSRLPVLGAGGGPTNITPAGFNAMGAAYQGGVQFMRRGGIMRGPTAFKTSRGIAIGGEAGNEAVLPLTRTGSGKLGVSAVGGGGELGITIIDQRGADAPPIERRGTDASGNPILVIRDIVRQEIGRSLRPAMGAQFGLSPALQQR